MKMKKIIASLLCLTFVFSATGCAAQGATSTTTIAAEGASVKIGVLLPYTGSSAAMGNLQRKGIEMAVKNKNDAGGILGGKQIELIFADSTGVPEVGVTEIERLITEKKVDALIGPYNSSVATPTSAIAEKYQVPYMITNATADEVLTKAYKYVFRANFCNSGNAKDMVDFVVSIGEETGKPAKTVAIIYENTDWGKGMAVSLPEFCKEAGLEVVMSESYPANSADMSSIAIKLKDADPDVIFPMSYLNDAMLLTKTLAEYKVDSTIVASAGGFSVPDFITKSGDVCENLITIAAWDTSVLAQKTEKAKELNEQFKADYSDGLDLETYSANGWMSAMVLINAIDRAGSTDKEKIKDALAATDIKSDGEELTLHAFEGIKFENVRGMMNQNVYATSIVLQILDGKFEMVGPLTMITGENKIIWPAPVFEER